MKVVIVVRMTANYANLNKDNFRSQINDPYKPKTELQIFIANNMLDLWDRIFCMPYIKYRSKICDIASRNLNNTGCLIIRGYQEFIEWYSKDEEDCIIVPVDDDDWFSPNISDVSKLFKESTNIVIWKNTVLHSLTRFHFGVVEGNRMGSNNWAVRKSYLKKMDDKEARHFVLLSHVHAESHVKNKMKKAEVSFVEDSFNIYNRHIASLNFIRSQIDKGDVVKELTAISKRDVTNFQFTDKLAWAEEYKNDIYSLRLRLTKPEILLI